MSDNRNVALDAGPKAVPAPGWLRQRGNQTAGSGIDIQAGGFVRIPVETDVLRRCPRHNRSGVPLQDIRVVVAQDGIDGDSGRFVGDQMAADGRNARNSRAEFRTPRACGKQNGVGGRRDLPDRLMLANPHAFAQACGFERGVHVAGVDDGVVGEEPASGNTFGADAESLLGGSAEFEIAGFVIGQGEFESTAVTVVDGDAGDRGQFGHEIFVLGKTGQRHSGPRGIGEALAAGSQHSGSGPTGLRAGFAGVEYGDPQAALREAPGAGETYDPSADDGNVLHESCLADAGL